MSEMKNETAEAKAFLEFAEKLELLAEKFEVFSKQFIVGLESSTALDRKWYSLTDMLLRILRIAVNCKFDPLATAVLAGLHGSLNVLGIKGTTQLILNLRRKKNAHTSGKIKADKTQPAVPGVRDGNGTYD